MRSRAGRRGDQRATVPAVLRVSDAERRVVVDELGRHYADGRLTADELQERLTEAWRSRTDGDLALALRELPALPAAPAAPAEVAMRPRRRPRLRVSIHAALAASGVYLAWTVEATGPTPGDQWPLALGVAWGAVVAAHAGIAWSGREVAHAG
jgi:Domain of unknown function (DUF1707)